MNFAAATFTDVVRDVSGGNAKVLQSAFLAAGAIPVIDQGQSFIAGYTDDEDSKFRSEQLPVVVFGDHTKAVKFIDFPFAIGADGVKVLKPRNGCDAKYLYHFLRQARLPDAGYSRHFKFVKELRIPLPSLTEQRRIAAILDKADALRAKRRDAIAKLDQLLQSVFLDMFGDPGTNPKGWPLRRIDEISECLDRHRKPITAKDRTAGYVPYYGANGQQGWIDRQIFNEPLVLVAEDGGHFDQPARGVAYRIDGPAWVNNHAHILRAKSGVIDTEYLHRALRHFDFMPYVSGSTRAKLTQGQLNSVPIPVPPIELQREFADIVERIEQQQRTLNLNARHLDTLFASLQHRAFSATL